MNPTNRCTKNDVEEWIKPTLENEGLKSYKIIVSGSSSKGDGYLGDITFVQINGVSKKNEQKEYNFVLKCGKKSKELREVMPIRQVFENEMHFYTKTFPTFLKFQKEKNVKEPFTNVAKCYDTKTFEEMEVLVLENMKKKGYDLHDRKLPMNKDQIEKIMKCYGKLHAISYALKDQKPEVFKELTENLIDILSLLSEKNKGKEFVIFEDILKLAQKANEQEIVEKIHILNKNPKRHNEITDPTDPYAVILHGDCWNNNFLFKYENGKLIDVCFLDFQLSKLASPVHDLSYFLFTCLGEDTVEYFDQFNNLYYETLSASLREMGSDPNKLFPYEEFLNQWKKFYIFGLGMMPFIMKICLVDKDNIPDLVESAESGDDLTTTFRDVTLNMEKYRQRTFPLMKLLISKGFV